MLVSTTRRPSWTRNRCRLIVRSRMQTPPHPAYAHVLQQRLQSVSAYFLATSRYGPRDPRERESEGEEEEKRISSSRNHCDCIFWQIWTTSLPQTTRSERNPGCGKSLGEMCTPVQGRVLPLLLPWSLASLQSRAPVCPETRTESLSKSASGSLPP